MLRLKSIKLLLLFVSLVIYCILFSEQNSAFRGKFGNEQKRTAVLYRGYLWPATYDKNRQVTKVFIPYTVKTGGWFRGLGKHAVFMFLFNFSVCRIFWPAVGWLM